MMIVIACCFKTRIWDACPDPDSLLHLVQFWGWGRPLGRLKAGQGWADREMLCPGNATGRSLGRGPTGDAPRSHREYRVFTEGQKSCVFIQSPVPGTGQGLPSVKGTVHLVAQVWAVLQWLSGFPEHSMQLWLRKSQGWKGGGCFQRKPATVRSSSAGGCSSEQSIRWAERRADAREALDTVKWFVGKVALQKHRGNSVLFDYSVRKTA